MDEKNPGPTDAQTDEKVPLPIVVVDDEEKVILRKIDLQLVSNSSLFPPRVELLI
jgi:ACS family allantoate permease-like MFS transporter